MRFVRRSIKLPVAIHYVLEQVFSFLKLSISSLLTIAGFQDRKGMQNLEIAYS